jgi:hypothetical protein
LRKPCLRQFNENKEQFFVTDIFEFGNNPTNVPIKGTLF